MSGQATEGFSECVQVQYEQTGREARRRVGRPCREDDVLDRGGDDAAGEDHVLKAEQQEHPRVGPGRYCSPRYRTPCN
jgi:hypothetical protein